MRGQKVDFISKSIRRARFVPGGVWAAFGGSFFCGLFFGLNVFVTDLYALRGLCENGLEQAKLDKLT